MKILQSKDCINKVDKIMGDLNKKYIINKAEKILEKCEEKYKDESKNKKKLRELEKECKKLKRYNLTWKILLALVAIASLIIVF